MKRILFMAVVFFFLSALPLPVSCQESAQDILKAVILVRATIPDGARTANYLGTLRQGNGVVIDSNGLILTIGYVVLQAETIEVVGPDEKVVRATLVGQDFNSGLALIRAEASIQVSPMRFGQSSAVKVDDPLLVASYAGPEAVQGARVVSRQEFVANWEYLLEDPIYTSPPFNDFAGAALLDRDGRLVGIGSLFTGVYVPGNGKVPCNMFVPVDLINPILADLIAKGRPSEPPRPWLGIQAGETPVGVAVMRVSPDGPGEKARVQPGDIILRVANQKVTGLADFYRKVWSLGGAGVDVPLSILRGSQINDVTLHSADRYAFLLIQPGK
jgi:S1-C subfamily serine protease